ncbi:hypothetical protein R1flu_020577 [Riccia fluitans]|uniref:Uncharacterized protein n=1 Tax=Riccia fluitans TaxID=41844 RepID=A0ABD1ZQD4_9MARC
MIEYESGYTLSRATNTNLGAIRRQEPLISPLDRLFSYSGVFSHNPGTGRVQFGRFSKFPWDFDFVSLDFKSES